MDGGGPVLRAVLRQLSTRAAIRALPTPCRARAVRAGGEPGALGAMVGVEPLALHGPAWAMPSWGEGVIDVGPEVWDLDDGFALPPPMLEMDLGGGGDVESVAGSNNGDGDSPTGDVADPAAQRSEEEILQQILVERLTAKEPVLLPLAGAILAGGRRFPHARGGPRRAQPTPGGSRIMRWRQQRRMPAPRHGSVRQNARPRGR
mmetsp:Transcript_44378/g.77989  ORF Transcript_44378/g.77989 Transcript_44378/m.77989 type:complete len:204 (+) Transcript_44378:538-1149(+)